MELWVKASYIEEIKEAFEKRYISLKSRMKQDGNLSLGLKQSAVKYTKEMTDHVNQCYYGVKAYIEKAPKNDRVANQIERNIKSIRSYKEKIYNLCDHGSR